MAAQLRLQDAKQKLLTYGKMAQKTKEEAMTEFENDEYKSDDQHICDWVQQNCPQFTSTYYEYQSASHRYMAALQEVDPSAAEEWKPGQTDTYRKLDPNKDAFEFQYWIRLPEE